MYAKVDNNNKPITRKKFLNYRFKENLIDFTLLLPALVFLAIFTFYPLFYSLYLSLTDWNLIRPTKEFVGLANYQRMLTDPQFSSVMKVTLLYTILDVSLVMTTGLTLAVLLNKDSKLFGIARFFIFMPHYISMVIASLVFVWMLNYNYGLFNQVLAIFGIKAIDWLNTPATALWSVLFVAVWKGSGFCMIVFIGGLRGIPVEYYESASIDGASRWREFRSITLPLLSPTTLFLFITTFIGAMQVFQSVDIMTGGGPFDATRVMVMWIYDVAFKQFKIGRSSTLVVIFFTIIVVLSFVQYFISKKKVYYEG